VSIVTATQTITGVAAPTMIMIHSFLIASMQRLHHSEHLPIKNNIVKFSGELFLVEFDEPLFMVEKLEIVHE
jgi:hypothetical protein